ncbi:MAG: hypothetical protein K2P70_13265 [Hyphomonadaceae bacterium]|nr:hypothetical protein [Hyphomonadaceae bacterium]
MSYIRVAWRHSSIDEPILLYGELDDDRWEVRKVEVFRDGRMGYAASNSTFAGTGLRLAPVPPLLVIAQEPEFDAQEISSDEFELVWIEAINR